MTIDNLAEDIESHVFEAPLQDTARGQFSLGGRIIDAVRDRIQNLGGLLTIGDDVKKMLRDAALQVYDKVNLPTVPDMIELPIKQALRPVIETLLNQLLGL